MSDYFDRIERQLVQRVEAAPRRSSRLSAGFGYVVPAVSVLIVIAVVAAFVGVNANRSAPASGSGDANALVFTAVAANPRAALGKSVDASIATLRHRLAAVAPGVRVSRAGDDLIVRGASPSARAAIAELAVPGKLSFFDWEASVLTPNGKTVAEQLRTQDPSANTTAISQGGGSAAPGDPGAGAGGMSLYAAARLAARQPPTGVSNTLQRIGQQVYLFGAPGSPACAAAARAAATTVDKGQHCLLSGPVPTVGDLSSGLPAGVTMSEGLVVLVPQGTVVLQAANVSASRAVSAASPTARFYVLKDNSSLTGRQITKPRAATDQAGNPDVQFSFTPKGQTAFEAITRGVAQRGAEVSGLGQMFEQHFAVALDNQLLTVPSIDFKQYPDGITGSGGADITGGLTSHSARILSTLLRYGPLSVNLIAH